MGAIFSIRLHTKEVNMSFLDLIHLTQEWERVLERMQKM